ncbi:MAG TPA: pyrimidine-nucleoside phosphorylase [Candidatus Limnocylindrales bacterium]|nr:pyrimidine-nucleoside phosphorylase [Candidatus Limnocylindrales bacterium]
MRVYDLILKKRNGFALTQAEIDYFVSGYVKGSIPDYQMAALAMAIYFQGMGKEETLYLTKAMVASGDTISLQEIPGVKVDKHSTGGVGDTTTLVLAPLVAAAGAPVAKLSGRGLGHTGGTLDKLESIPGFMTSLTVHELVQAVRQIGVAVAGQTGNLVPADKMLYALRDVTATVDSLPLIASSIMSKKLAAGADALVLDVKTGNGAFLKDLDQAFALAQAMVEIGNGAGRETVAVVTNMEQPLGRAVGNALEVEEAIQIMRGAGPFDLEELCLILGGWMLFLAKRVSEPEEGRTVLKSLLRNGAALQKFKEMIINQHGNAAVIDDLSLLPRAPYQHLVVAEETGYVCRLLAEPVGLAAMALGAGRAKKGTVIDPAVGLTLEKKVGDLVKAGDTLAVIHAREGTSVQVESAQAMIRSAYGFRAEPAEPPALLFGYVNRDGARRV